MSNNKLNTSIFEHAVILEDNGVFSLEGLEEKDFLCIKEGDKKIITTIDPTINYEHLQSTS